MSTVLEESAQIVAAFSAANSETTSSAANASATSSRCWIADIAPPRAECFFDTRSTTEAGCFLVRVGLVEVGGKVDRDRLVVLACREGGVDRDAAFEARRADFEAAAAEVELAVSDESFFLRESLVAWPVDEMLSQGLASSSSEAWWWVG